MHENRCQQRVKHRTATDFFSSLATPPLASSTFGHRDVILTAYRGLSQCLRHSRANVGRERTLVTENIITSSSLLVCACVCVCLSLPLLKSRFQQFLAIKWLLVADDREDIFALLQVISYIWNFQFEKSGSEKEKKMEHTGLEN